MEVKLVGYGPLGEQRFHFPGNPDTVTIDTVTGETWSEWVVPKSEEFYKTSRWGPEQVTEGRLGKCARPNGKKLLTPQDGAWSPWYRVAYIAAFDKPSHPYKYRVIARGPDGRLVGFTTEAENFVRQKLNGVLETGSSFRTRLREDLSGALVVAVA